jgi:hypothetical protein
MVEEVATPNNEILECQNEPYTKQQEEKTRGRTAITPRHTTNPFSSDDNTSIVRITLPALVEPTPDP